ncbi:MAG: L-rhamnose mutarotase [Bacteroidota bacterium]|nr:L-rhamnose mutarotase [Bacteroidota bacterium]
MSSSTMRYCLALDLKNDPVLMEAYKAHHRKVWPEILKSIRDSGIVAMEIYHCENRLFMIMETAPGFSFERKTADDLGNPKVQEWENLMNTYQQVLPGTETGGKWRLMDKIFSL